jgi:hypothetical protein
MRSKQFGVLGVVLALIFGVRTTNRSAARTQRCLRDGDREQPLDAGKPPWRHRERRFLGERRRLPRH